eukprot:858165-Pyramimonas_sp.AAC.1
MPLALLADGVFAPAASKLHETNRLDAFFGGESSTRNTSSDVSSSPSPRFRVKGLEGPGGVPACASSVSAPSSGPPEAATPPSPG